MSTTLTNGLKLPDKGSVDWYADMQSNYTILDGAVGTVAEHTSALAGKAPLVHTHTKSDVTDLLNSNFIPSANNTYDLGSSSYQWNNLYANTVNAANAVYTNAVWASSVRARGTSNALILAAMETWEDGGRIFMYGKDNANGSVIYADIDHNDGIHSKTGVQLDIRGFYPAGVSRHLGLAAANNRWLTFNGINPGALSLPGAYQGINDQIKNPSDQLNAIDLNGGSNTWVSDVDCYLYFYIPNNKFTWIRIFWPPTLVRCGQTFVPVPNESSDYSGFLPVPANTTVVIQIKGTQVPVFRRSACLGNV